MSIPGALRRMVIQRARKRCEYCRLAQAGQEAAFQIDHVRPIADKGETKEDNLALACVSSSLRKGARRAGRDPASGREVALYNPRRQDWLSHFKWRGNRVMGVTPTGRATVELLKMNRALVVAIRAEERLLGRHPPEE